MAPENEGKPAVASMGARTEVSVDTLLEIEQLIVKVQVHMEKICSSDLSFDGNLKPDSQDPIGDAQLNCKPEALRVFANKHEDVKICNELALYKLRNLITGQKGSAEDVSSNMNLKRSRSLNPLHAPRVPSITTPLDCKVGVLPDGAGSPRGSHGTNSFDVPSPAAGDMLPLKFIRTGDNTKAAFQKPSTIFMPTAKLGVPILDIPTVPAPTSDPGLAAPAVGNKPSSPKKRSGRSRRERNRTKNKVVDMPEPVMQKLLPGDTNKIPEDGFLWRKYGNKPIKTASYKRGYYKCRHYKEVKCNATKIVQQTNNDPNTFSVHYKGEHTCSQRGTMVGVNGAQHSGGSDSASLADQVNETMNAGDPRSPDEDKDDVLDDMDWPKDEDCVSDSEDVFPSSEGGEAAVESVTAPLAPVELEQPASPLSPLISFEMPAMPAENMPSNLSEIPVETQPPWAETLSTPGDFKVKFLDTCPPEACTQEIDQNGLLLDLINGGLMGDNVSIHDINYWCQDLDSFSHFPSDNVLF